MKILKFCEYCKKEFIAKKTTSKTCSDDCAKRLYKLKQRNSKIAQAELETEIKRRPLAYIKEEELKTIQSKENLTLKVIKIFVVFHSNISLFFLLTLR